MVKYLKSIFPKNKKMYRGLVVFILFAFIGATKAFGQQNSDGASKILSQEQIAGFKEQAIKTINDLEKFVQVIANKKNSLDKRNDAIELALDLFISDTTTIEISSLSSNKTHTYPIGGYLARLKLLPYASVKITWYKIYLGRDFVKGPDGYYYGSATFLQKFEGISNNEVGNYTDITKRHIIIVLKKLDVLEGDNKTDKYVLKLGDIKVEETTHG